MTVFSDLTVCSTYIFLIIDFEYVENQIANKQPRS